jgi:HAD superfamily hydrolase (TIGR01509 family)
VIFDLDGTLVDSYSAHFHAWTSIAEDLGHTLTEPEFQRQFGLKNEPILAELHAWTGRTPPSDAAVAALADEKERRYRARISEVFPAMAGAGGLIASLRGAGWKVAVGSSAPRANIDFCLDRFQQSGVSFDAVACGCDVSRGKPEPDVFLLAADRLGVRPEACAVVEDASAGIEAARRAGMASVGLCSTGRTRDEFAGADHVVDTLDELGPDVFARLLGHTA